jgi:hypothetical protein
MSVERKLQDDLARKDYYEWLKEQEEAELQRPAKQVSPKQSKRRVMLDAINSFLLHSNRQEDEAESDHSELRAERDRLAKQELLQEEEMSEPEDEATLKLHKGIAENRELIWHQIFRYEGKRETTAARELRETYEALEFSNKNTDYYYGREDRDNQ